MNSALKRHIEQFYKTGIRFDGRKMLDYRDIEVKTGISVTAEGSASCRMGETMVLAGIKMSLDKPYPDTPDEGVLSVNAELLPLSNPEFESGPPNNESIELARVIDRGIRESHAVDLKQLCVTPREKVWMVSLDIITINDAGNLIDCAGLAALAALKNARFPSFDGTSIDYKKPTDKKLPLTQEPIPVTVFKVGKYLIVDPDYDEEQIAEARLTVTTMQDGRLCAMQKGGDFPLMPEDVAAILEISIEKGKELRRNA
jgi:exosome complex component RRP42